MIDETVEFVRSIAVTLSAVAACSAFIFSVFMRYTKRRDKKKAYWKKATYIQIFQKCENDH